MPQLTCCPNCGLPMSRAYPDGDENNAPTYVCDGPDDLTDTQGCGASIPAPARSQHAGLTRQYRVSASPMYDDGRTGDAVQTVSRSSAAIGDFITLNARRYLGSVDDGTRCDALDITLTVA